jgi:C4-dicarboxylate transporter DctM subunit
MILTLFISLAALMFFSVPLYIALTGSTLFAFFLFSDMPLVAVAQRLFGGIDRFSLMAIPFFVLAANAMKRGGMARRILKLADVLVGGYAGGMSLTVVVSCLFFGALCGSAPATIVALGAILYPSLIERKYGESFSIGLVASSASVALLIPPSLTMVVYGAVTGASVGALFIAGFGAGLIFAIPFLIYSYVFAKTHKIKLEKGRTVKEKLDALKESAWALGVPIIIIGGIYGGIFTPTEAAAVSAIYAIFVGMFIYRELTLKELYKVGVESGVTTAMIMIMIAGAMAFSWILVIEQIPQSLSTAMLSLTSSRIGILLIMNVIMLIAGMFVDGTAFILILGPLFMPIATSIGVDLVHLGIIMVTNACIGMYTPPFGLNLFVGSSISGLPYSKVVKGIWPFIGISLIALVIITYFPQLYLWLPNLAYGK